MPNPDIVILKAPPHDHRRNTDPTKIIKVPAIFGADAWTFIVIPVIFGAGPREIPVIPIIFGADPWELL